MRILADPSSVYVIAIYPAAILNFQKKNSCGEIWEKIVPPRRWFNSSSVAARKEIIRHSIRSRFQKPSSGWAFRSEHAQFETKRPQSLIRTLKSEFKFTLRSPSSLDQWSARSSRLEHARLEASTSCFAKRRLSCSLRLNHWKRTILMSDITGLARIGCLTKVELLRSHLSMKCHSKKNIWIPTWVSCYDRIFCAINWSVECAH